MSQASGVNDDVVALEAAGQRRRAARATATRIRFRTPRRRISWRIGTARRIDIARSRDAYERLARRADAVIVEGAGGALVPLERSARRARHRARTAAAGAAGRRRAARMPQSRPTDARSRSARGDLTLAGWVATRIDPRDAVRRRECRVADSRAASAAASRMTSTPPPRAADALATLASALTHVLVWRRRAPVDPC